MMKINSTINVIYLYTQLPVFVDSLTVRMQQYYIVVSRLSHGIVFPHFTQFTALSPLVAITFLQMHLT